MLVLCVLLYYGVGGVCSNATLVVEIPGHHDVTTFPPVFTPAVAERAQV